MLLASLRSVFSDIASDISNDRLVIRETRSLLSKKLGRQNIDLLDSRRLGKKLGSFLLQRRRDSARKMRLPPRLIREGVEYAKCRRPKAYCESRNCCRFLSYKRQTRA
jgi:hypothetical protein